MTGCYLNALPRKFMHTMAGHPAQMGYFEIRRASVTPPDELMSMIWPELEGWKGCFGPGEGQTHDLAAMGLTSLLFYLREVILQDAVILREQFPNSQVWNHPVFQHKAYAPFAQQVRALVQEEEEPSPLRLLTQALPALADYLRSIDTHLQELTALVSSQAKSAKAV